MKYAKDYGFLPENDGLANAKALQEAVKEGGDIYIDLPGTYLLADQVLLYDDTNLFFCAGSYIKREENPEETAYVFVNEGAYTHTYNKNIKIQGLNLICNGVVREDITPESKKIISGLNGHICFFYAKNIVIEDFQCLDLPSRCFGIHICTFENAVIERVRIEGKKDAVHFGYGSKFVIRHGLFKTFDDPIALNAHDYTGSNPQMGWIENGLIEDCYDIDDDSTDGYFCRILAGSWPKWYEGIKVQRSDSVFVNGRLYRVNMPVDGKIYTSVTPPCHESGLAEYDGIWWVAVQDEEYYDCGCRNIHFKDIYLQKKRPTAFSIHFDKDNWSRSYYPNTDAPVQENLIFENVVVENDNIPELLYSRTPVDNVKFINCTLKDGAINLKHIETEGIVYPETNILFSGTMFKDDIDTFITCDEGLKANVTFANTMNKTFKTKVKGDVNVKSTDIEIVKE
ncbi:MAG: hypothetical protein J6A69_02370 [Clostridia bacterium]|nr:hypothetical protein [Clostridia bacterium]